MQVKALALFHMGLFNFFLSLWEHFRIVYTHTFPSSCIRLCQHLLYCIPDLFTTFFDLIPAGVWMYLCICVCVCLRACRTVLCRVMWGACVHCGMSWTVPESELHGPSSSRLSFKAVNTDCAAWSSHALNWRYTHTHQAHISHHREIKQHSYISTTKYIV